MNRLPTVLLFLSFPAGLLGYGLAVRLIEALPLPEDAQGPITLFVPLFIAGLVMLPFLVPFFDRKAKQDLAAYRRSQDPDAQGEGDAPDAPDSP